MKISYGVTVHDEIEGLRALISRLIRFVQDGDEIIVQYDAPRVSGPVLAYLDEVTRLFRFIKVVPFALNGDFSAYRNHLNVQCGGDYIFQIDADELPGLTLLDRLRFILRSHADYEVFMVSRINTVAGLTAEQAKAWGWVLDAKGWINFPDLQRRIYRNRPHLRWEGAVHEMLVGGGLRVGLPNAPPFCLLHAKTLERQHGQLRLYQSMRLPD